jgi:hypothetical protein
MNKLLIISILLSSAVYADPPRLIDRQTGKYLGTLSSNQNDPDSVSNPHGNFGSKYSPDSINNPHSEWGSPHSDSSPNNPYATNAPSIEYE